MKLNTIFLIGPQGSGKGTQARILADKLGFFYWEMGAILRSLKNESSDLAKKVTHLIDQGILLEDEILLEVVKQKLSDVAPEKGVIFDGIPRRIGQAEFLLNVLKNQGRTNFVTLFINLPEQESINRLLARAEKEHRPDDTKEKIEFRLKQYTQNTLPVLDFLKNHSDFFEIDGSQNIDEVTQQINQKLGL